jgi:hypothetical protein
MMIAFTNQHEAKVCRHAMRNDLMNRYQGSFWGRTSNDSHNVIVKQSGYTSAYVNFGIQDSTVTVNAIVSAEAGVQYQKDVTNPRISDDFRFHWVIDGDDEVAKATRQICVLLNYHFCVDREQALAENH